MQSVNGKKHISEIIQQPLSSVIVFPNCKINPGLHILNKREDGYHSLETVFYPIQLKDALEIIHYPPADSNADIIFSSTGFSVEGNADDNLCVKAYHLLKNKFPELPPVQMHLHKAIPMGAGLGGGSADAAFTLKMMNEKFHLNLSSDQLINFALQLGSDCPFFIINEPCIATGRGEILEKIDLDLSKYKIVMVNPGIHINTGWAFSEISPCIPSKSLKEIIQQPIETWKEELKNDFEKPVFHHHPELKQIKDQLYAAGAVYAAVSGSGSTVFGIFQEQFKVQRFFPDHFFVKEIFG